MFRQAGVIRVDTLQELFDVAVLLGAGPIRAGRRVAVVTNTAGGAVMTVDRLVREGLHFVSPVLNIGFESLAESYRVILPQVLRDPSIDAVIVLFTPVGPTNEEAVRVAISAALCEVANDPHVPGEKHPYEKPVVANFLTTGDYRVRFLEVDSEREIPIYPFPEQAVRALAKVTAYHEYREKDPGIIPELSDIDTARARDVIDAVSGADGRRIEWPTVREALGAIGIASVPEELPGVDMRALFNVAIETDPLFGPLLRLRLATNASGGGVIKRTTTSIPAVRLLPLTDADARGLWGEACLNSPDSGLEGHEQTVIDTMLRLSQWVEDVDEVAKADLLFTLEEGRAICIGGEVEAVRKTV